jgi:hypothetical protein
MSPKIGEKRTTLTFRLNFILCYFVSFPLPPHVEQTTNIVEEQNQAIFSVFGSQNAPFYVDGIAIKLKYVDIISERMNGRKQM